MTKLNCIAKLNWVTKACVIFFLWAAAAIALPAQTYTVLQRLDGANGEPYAGLVQGADGKLYGTTFYGDAVFNITPGGELTTLYVFCSQGGNECTDGASPETGLIQSTDGNFYGTTSNGGTGYDNNQGTVFKITPSGKLTTLYSFCSNYQNGMCLDGAKPSALLQGTDGNFYGATAAGGTNISDAGTIFKITSSGRLTTLYTFCSQGGQCPDGRGPSGLVLGTDGKLYGTTGRGGTGFNSGTVFSITPSGQLTTLYSFCTQAGCPDGYYPVAGLVEGRDGSFYGATSLGGGVFKITPSGDLTILYRFCSVRSNTRNCPDGEEPVAALVLGTDGNFYGTTEYGGTHGGYEYGGTIFKITPEGRLATLYSFCSLNDCTDGEIPMAGLVQDTNGTFYGTTVTGGAIPDGYGVVFSLSMGLGPFVETNPAAGKVGATVGILGTDLTGATGVKFNGTATAFRVVSSIFIEAKVPLGATTGTVTVQLPGGPLSSNVPFIVLR